MSRKKNTPEDDWLEEEINPPGKVALSIRIDEDVLAYFKANGRGYQTRMNAVLRSYMQAMKRREDKE